MKVVGQTLFLGASVISFSSNIGWGGSRSSLTVELVEDIQPFGQAPFRKFYQNQPADYGHLHNELSPTLPDEPSRLPLPSGHSGNTDLGRNFYDIPQHNTTSYPDNHYYTCVGDSCYVNELGGPYVTNVSKEKNVPGKIYYEWVNNKFVSKYWSWEDPGFFATGTRIQPDGKISIDAGHNARSLNTPGGLWTYDIINTPVYFKFDNFEFIGLVKNWERNNRPGGITYSVTIEGFENLLDNCWIILDPYGGSIFGAQGAGKGTPVNNIDLDQFNCNGLLSQGNIPNIFNVYGFLESFGIDFFGGSNLNDNGLRAVDVLSGLAALTSSHTRLARDAAFSPFGRILTKSMADINGRVVDVKNFGIITPTIGTNRNVINNPPPLYNTFSLDLSDIGGLISDYRIENTSKSISSLLQELTSANGTDYTTRVIPAITNDSLYQFVIKIMTVDRTTYRSPYNIRSIVTNLENQRFSISNSNFGQDVNENVTHKFIIGGPQQRLLQIKNYRLPYAQTNYIYNPILKKFITLNRPWNKARVPDVMSTRHPYISTLSLGPYIGDRININDTERNVRFTNQRIDNKWKDEHSDIIRRQDGEVDISHTGRTEQITQGNYRISSRSLVPFRSHIVTENDLNPDVQPSQPVPCSPGQLPDGQTLDTHYIDTTCVYFVPTPCPSKSREEPNNYCADNPEQPGGNQSNQDPTMDDTPDFQEGGFVPVTGFDAPRSRYLNLHNDWICPYFGRTLEERLPPADDANEFRSIRPVHLDLWTNQIVVGFYMHELPNLNIGEPLSLYDYTIFNSGNGIPQDITNGLDRGGTLPAGRNNQPNQEDLPNPAGSGSAAGFWQPLGTDPERQYIYNKPGFVVTESEMRASQSFDSYLAYCLGKSKYSKPDLFMMLVSAYQLRGDLFPNEDFGTYYGVTKDDLKGGMLSRGARISEQNISQDGINSQPANPHKTDLNMNWNLYLNHNFIKDLQIVCEFIKNLADRYYGKEYMIKLPDMILYRDSQYASIRIPGVYSSIAVYTGSNKIFGNYQLAEGAWEEPGNFIDDCIMIGSNASKIFTDENNLIEPIAGYNNSLNIDDVRQRWCQLDAQARIERLFGTRDNNVGIEMQSALDGVKAEIEGMIRNMYNDNRSETTERIRDKLNGINAIKEKRELEGMKELREFGTTINCYSTLDKANISMTWGLMWQSINESIEEFLDNPTVDGLETLKDQWPTTVNNARESLPDVDLLTFGVHSLDISGLGGGSDADYVIIPVSSKKEPFGRQSPRSSKLFIKANYGRIIYKNIINLTDPRAIMKVNKLDVFDTSLAYVKDPGLSIIANIAIEDSAIYMKIKNRLNQAREARNAALENGDTELADQILEDIHILKTEVNYIRYLKAYIVPEIDPRYLVTTGPKSNPSVEHARMAPRAAHPYFFAIPLKSNQFCYGPWTNYADNFIAQPYINNLIHNSKVEYDPELVPWKYGSSSALDRAVGYRLNSDVNYQTILERGSISIVGPPIFGLGGIFFDNPNSTPPANQYRFDNDNYRVRYIPNTFFDTKRNGYREVTYDCLRIDHRGVSSNGPLISTISIQVGIDGVTTTYQFQTYNPKTGLFSKTYSDAIREFNKDTTKLQKAIASVQNNLTSKMEAERLKTLKEARTGRTPFGIDKFKTQLYGESPVEIFVGQNITSLKNPSWWTDINTNLIRDVGDNPLPTGNTIEDRKQFLNQKRMYSWVGAVMGKEIGAELLQQYNSKAAMSLDGLMSPVSFYPTQKNRTFNISTYVAGSGVPVGNGNTDTTCPYCYNKRYITIPYIDYHTNAGEALTTTFYDDKTPDDIEIPCPVCSRAKIYVKKNDKFPDRETGLPDINLYSLNPIVVSSGEFRNPYASGIDRCRHSIGAISRGEYNSTEESFYINTNINTYRNGHNPDFSRFDTKVQELENINVLLNQRFLALRGPLMMHGWGFDTDGYPIPNAYDMPYSIDDKGRHLRFQLVSDTGNNKFGSNNLETFGKYEVSIGDTAPLGDIITTRYEWKGTGNGINTGNGKWTKKNKPSKKFYLNWAERPDLWPVGPIDVRWDNERRVWDASGGGCKEEILPPFIVTNRTDISTLQEFLENKTENKCPYRNIYVTLESDMIKEDDYDSTYSTRAFIDDIEYNKEPVQNGYRRLVYVIDKTGYTAPRGTKLLCRYDRFSGFYEPIGKPSVTAIGTIGTGNQARIEAHYVSGRRAGQAPVFVISYSNPLGLSASVGTKGIFIFINGKWTLSSARS